jgi:hypothetical protein
LSIGVCAPRPPRKIAGNELAHDAASLRVSGRPDDEEGASERSDRVSDRFTTTGRVNVGDAPPEVAPVAVDRFKRGTTDQKESSAGKQGDAKQRARMGLH